MLRIVAFVHVVMNISSFKVLNYPVSFPILAHSHVCGMETRTLHNKKHTVMYVLYRVHGNCAIIMCSMDLCNLCMPAYITGQS